MQLLLFNLFFGTVGASGLRTVEQLTYLRYVRTICPLTRASLWCSSAQQYFFPSFIIHVLYFVTIDHRCTISSPPFSICKITIPDFLLVIQAHFSSKKRIHWVFENYTLSLSSGWASARWRWKSRAFCGVIWHPWFPFLLHLHPNARMRWWYLR